MALGGQIPTAISVLAAITLIGAGWSWWGVAKAREPIGPLASRVVAFRHEAARLAALPDLPPLAPLTETLASFLGALPPTMAVKFTAPNSAGDTARGPVKHAPDMAGVRLAVLEVAEPHPEVGLPQLALTTLDGWQEHWPIHVSKAIWNGRALVANLTLYGR